MRNVCKNVVGVYGTWDPGEDRHEAKSCILGLRLMGYKEKGLDGWRTGLAIGDRG